MRENPTGKGLAAIYRQEIIKDVTLFTSQSTAAFYDKLFTHLDFTLPKAATGRRGFPKEAMVCTFIVIKREGFSQITDLADYLDNNRLIAYYCGFNIMKPLTSYWTYDQGRQFDPIVFRLQFPIREHEVLDPQLAVVFIHPLRPLLVQAFSLPFPNSLAPILPHFCPYCLYSLRFEVAEQALSTPQTLQIYEIGGLRKQQKRINQYTVVISHNPRNGKSHHGLTVFAYINMSPSNWLIKNRLLQTRSLIHYCLSQTNDLLSKYRVFAEKVT